MKKIMMLMLTLVLAIVSVIAPIANLDTPEETKAAEWAIGYARRCGTVKAKAKRRRSILKKIALAPLGLMFGIAADPNERYWAALAGGATPDEAKASYSNASAPVSKGKRATHPHWSEMEERKVTFISAESLNDIVKARRGWFSAAKLEGFDGETVVAYKWFMPDGENPVLEPPKAITLNGVEYALWCAGQGGVKKGSAIYLKKSFLDVKTNGVPNRDLLDAPDGLPVAKLNQVRALRFTACEPTDATMKQVVVFEAKRRVDKAEQIPDGRPIKHVDVPNGYAISDADEVEQALADGGCIYGPDSGIKSPAAQFRNDGGLKCAGTKYSSKFVGKEATDVFGRKVVCSQETITVTTDCTKDIKPFLKKMKDGLMSGEEAYQAWLTQQGGPDAPIYSCPVHPTNGRVRLGRQIFGKFSQLSEEGLFKVVGRDLGKLATLGFEEGYKDNLRKKFRALRLPELGNVLDSPLLHQGEVKSYLSSWHKIASGGVEVDASLALAIADPAWVDDVYWGGKDVNDPTAGIIEAGKIGFGTPDKTGKNPYLGKKVVLGRFPQVKSGLPVIEVMCGAPCSGVVVVSMRPGDMVLLVLDADLDGDKFYVIDENGIVIAVDLANKIFNFPHVVFTKWEAEEKSETLEEYLGRNASWQAEESVGTFAQHQFVIDEMVPLLEEGEDWTKLVRPTLDKEGNYSIYVPIQEAFDANILLGVGGNMATDSGKLNHKPDAPEWVKYKFAFRPISQRDAHPNAIDTGFKKRHAAFLPGKYPGVEKGVLKRLHDLLMKHIPIQEVGRTEKNDFAYDENGRILPDIPKTLWAPSGFTPVPEEVWLHKFGNELDEIKFCPVLKPDSATAARLNADIKVVNGEDISLVTYFTQYATKIMSIQADLDDDKKGWTVAANDTFGDNLVEFVRSACQRNLTADEALWIVYNTLCRSYIGTSSQSRGTAYGMSQFLKLFEEMLISQVCKNAGKKPPKLIGDRKSIKDSVSETKTVAPTVETTDEEPPAETVNVKALLSQLEADDEEPPTETVDVKALLAQLEADEEEPPTETVDVKALPEQLNAETEGSDNWSIEIPEDEIDYEDDEE